MTTAGFLTGKAEWKGQIETTTQRIRSAPAVRLNEVRLSNASHTTDQFIELYNASTITVDLSNWMLMNTQSQRAPLRLVTIRAGTKLASHAYYLLSLPFRFGIGQFVGAVA